jgi:hypothetical protein
MVIGKNLAFFVTTPRFVTQKHKLLHVLIPNIFANCEKAHDHKLWFPNQNNWFGHTKNYDLK